MRSRGKGREARVQDRVTEMMHSTSFIHTKREKGKRKKRSGSGGGDGEPLEWRQSLNIDIT